MLDSIARLLEQAISNNLFPILQDLVAPRKSPEGHGILGNESEAPFHSGVDRVMRLPPGTLSTPTSSTTPAPALFQRALDLGQKFDNSGMQAPQKTYSSPTQQRWLLMGGEPLSPQSSPGPSPASVCAMRIVADPDNGVHDDVADIASTVESEQDTDIIFLKPGSDSDVVVLKGPPENISCRPRKHVLADAGVSKRPTKRLKCTISKSVARGVSHGNTANLTTQSHPGPQPESQDQRSSPPAWGSRKDCEPKLYEDDHREPLEGLAPSQTQVGQPLEAIEEQIATKHDMSSPIGEINDHVLQDLVAVGAEAI